MLIFMENVHAHFLGTNERGSLESVRPLSENERSLLENVRPFSKIERPPLESVRSFSESGRQIQNGTSEHTVPHCLDLNLVCSCAED
jgi:hypothetical protein